MNWNFYFSGILYAKDTGRNGSSDGPDSGY